MGQIYIIIALVVKYSTLTALTVGPWCHSPGTIAAFHFPFYSKFYFNFLKNLCVIMHIDYKRYLHFTVIGI